jgi:outer membrane protein assembly factor BamB
VKTRLAVLLWALLASSALSENWPQWRGPFFDGSTTETNLPTRWSQTENVIWRAPLPGSSAATPAVWRDSVFVSSPDAQKDLRLLCFNRSTGEVRWQKVVATGDREEGLNNCASPSPLTDGQRVIVMFATGELTAFDFSGQQLWQRNLAKEFGKFANMWMYGSSPMLYRGKLYIQALQMDKPEYRHSQDGRPDRESFLLCLEPETGKTIWRQLRPTDAVNESMESYSTPVPCEDSSGRVILVVGANYLTAHNPDTGTELWRFGGLNSHNELHWRNVPCPVAVGGLVVVSAPRDDPVMGIKTGGKGVVTQTHRAWTWEEFPTDCTTPLIYQKSLYVLDGDHQVVTCLDPQNGQKKWQGKLGVREIFRASPTGADGKLYCISEKGTALVLDAGPEFKVLSTIAMQEGPVRSSIAVSQGNLFIRTAKHLYCIGSK